MELKTYALVILSFPFAYTHINVKRVTKAHCKTG